MKRHAAVLLAALAAILAVTVTTAGLSTGQEPSSPTGTLEVVQRNSESTFKFVDNPPRGRDPGSPSPGDVAIIGGRLRDAANRPVGRVHSVFTRLEGRKKYVDQVSGTFVVAGDHIAVQGLSDGGSTTELAVTGGTGAYNGARGRLQITQTKNQARFRLTFIG